MNMDTVGAIADRYGIDISDSNIAINKAIAGARGSTTPDQSIMLVRTLVHEQLHVGQLQARMEYPAVYDPNSQWELAAEQYA